MPPAEFFDLLLADINGIFRGQRYPLSQMESLVNNGATFPASLYSMRFDGGVAEATGIGLCAGDNDYSLSVLPQTVCDMRWRDGGKQGVFIMRTPEGRKFFADPRAVLETVVNDFLAAGLTPVLAVELEFFLRAKNAAGNLYAMDSIDQNESLLDLITQSATAQNIALGGCISEYAPGQMEINLRHGDAVRACLEAILLKRTVRGCARRLGNAATFMAKPHSGISGSGMHIHLSFRNADGGFLFADEEKLLNAVAGALAVIHEGMLFFAPFDNSYRRFAPGNYVALGPAWGYENRSAAVRIPLAKKDSEKRLEFRLAGADANPYLVAAALLGGVLHGLKESQKPPKELKKEYAGAAKFPITWRAALDSFSRAKILPQTIAPAFMRHHQKIKESEWRHHRDYVSDYDKQFVGAVI